ncbi:hypothetical protein RugamoR57_49890 [Duganella caerulea]
MRSQLHPRAPLQMPDTAALVAQRMQQGSRIVESPKDMAQRGGISQGYCW